MVITCIVLYNYGDFNDDLIVSNLAYEVALEVRTAQVYGLSVLGTKDATTNQDNFDSGYGVHFDYDPNNTANDQTFYLFVDTFGTGKLQNSADDATFNGTCMGPTASPNPGECLEAVKLQGTNHIQMVCTVSDDSQSCDNTTGGNASYPATLDITFKRPNPDANVDMVELPASGTQQPQYKNAKIYIASGNDKTLKVITVDQSGQISVQ
jgi:hypothetical protein